MPRQINLDEVFFEVEVSERSRFRATVREYKGKRALDIRNYYKDEDGDWKPGKGAWLPPAVIAPLIDELAAQKVNIVACAEKRQQVVGP